MRKFLLVLEVSDDGKPHGEDMPEPTYLLYSEKETVKYLLQNWQRDAGIVPTIIHCQEVIP